MKNPVLRVKWSSAACDLSGYASASRNYIHSLLENNVDVSLNIQSFEPWAPQHLKDEVMGRKLYSILGKDNGAKVHIVHHTPDQLQRYSTDPNNTISLFAWETDKIPGSWVKHLNNLCREIWVPSQYIKDACLNSGIKKEVFVLPHAIPVIDKADYRPVSNVNGLRKDHFNFYSIFQFSERKNPIGLLQAYMEEFSREEDVTLIVKCYRKNDSVNERNHVRRKISEIKKATKGVNSPRILLIEGFLTPAEMQDLHYYGDCSVTMTRSEGFGLPTFEGMAFGNPAIAPNYSAFSNFLNNNVAYLVDTPEEISVTGMEHISILYSQDMFWGNPSVKHCKEVMREAFENRDGSKDKGLLGQTYVQENLSRAIIGKIMKERIEKNL